MKVTYKNLALAIAVTVCFATNAIAQVQVVNAPFQADLPIAAAPQEKAGPFSTGISPVQVPAQAQAQVQVPVQAPVQVQAPVPTPASVDGNQRVAAASPLFEIVGSDKNIREVLVRWSISAGWTHLAEHWAVDRDLPIAGIAGADYFGKDFVGATRKLMAASDLSDRPVHPCFYANRVVRVLPKAELCDKTNQ